MLRLLGHDWAADCAHVAFGRVKGMSTRQGNVIYLEDLLDEARDRALRNMRENIERRPDLEDETEVAEAVGMAAIFFSDLSAKRIKDYVFDWERMLALVGSLFWAVAGLRRQSGHQSSSSSTSGSTGTGASASGSASVGSSGSTTTTTHTGSLGDVFLRLKAQAKSNVVGYSTAFTVTAPTGDTEAGVSTGRATFNWDNRLEHGFDRITPFAEASPRTRPRRCRSV